MDVKEAVQIAKYWIVDVMGDESPTQVGLEEVEFDDMQKVWKITLGFSRPWNSPRSALSSFTGDNVQKRAYRTILIDDVNREVKAMKRQANAGD